MERGRLLVENSGNDDVEVEVDASLKGEMLRCPSQFCLLAHDCKRPFVAVVPDRNI